MRTIGLYIYINGVAKRIELFDDEMINVTSSIQDVNDISKIFTDYSQSFTVPASKNNNQIFSHWYENSVDNGFDARIRKDAYIEIDTIRFRSGKIQLEKASIKNGSVENYHITFFGSLISLKDGFKDRYLKDLDFSAYSFEYNGSNVISKVAGDVDGHVKFPLISSKNVWQYNTGGTTVDNWDIKNTGTPVYYDDLFPAMRVSEIFNVIATELGITFVGTFLNDLRFKRAFLLLKNSDEFKVISTPKIINFNSITATPSFRSDMFDFPNDEFIYDGGRCFNGSGVEVGSMFSNSKNAFLNLQFTANGLPYTFMLYFNGVKIIETNYLTTTSSGFNIAIPLYYGIGRYSFYISSYPFVTFTSQFSYTVTTPGFINTVLVDAGTQINSNYIGLSTYMPDIKIEDFFSGILKAFNLTSYSESNGVYRIEQINDWYSAGELRDLSQYLITENIDLERVTTYKQIKFNYEKSESFLNQNYKSRSVTEYGDLEYTLDIDGGEYKVQLPFENMLFQKFTGTNLQVGYSLKTDFNAYKPKPILLYDYGTLQGVSFYINDRVTSTLINNYNVFGQDTNISGITYTINWGLETSSFTNNPEINSLFEIYYKSYINNIFNKKSRLVKLKCILPNSVITKLKLNDRIIIRDKRYLINLFSTELNTGLVSFELLPDFRIGSGGAVTTTTTIAPTTTTTTTAYSGDCFDYMNSSGKNWVGNYITCSGTTVIGAVIPSGFGGCFRPEPVRTSGGVLTKGSICGTVTTSTTSSTTTTSTTSTSTTSTSTTSTSSTTSTTTIEPTTCNTYFNYYETDWLGDYKNCSGVWVYSAIVRYGESICARTGSPILILGDGNLELGVECGTTTTSTTSTTTTTVTPTCNSYYNFLGSDWIGDYQDCDGTWVYGATVPGYSNICARTGTPTTISGNDLRMEGECAV